MEVDATVGADLDGDGEVENSFGNVIDAFATFLDDKGINEGIVEGIEAGSLRTGLVYHGLDETGDDPSFEVDVLQLESALDGESTELRASRESFGPDGPRDRLVDASSAGGVLSATNGSFAFGYPLSKTLVLDLRAENVTFEGDWSSDVDGGVQIRNGTLHGAVPIESFADFLNRYMAKAACVNLHNRPFIDLSKGYGPAACAQVDTSNCAESGDVATVAISCPLVVSILFGGANVDLDGDGDNDALGLYLYLSAEGTKVRGLE